MCPIQLVLKYLYGNFQHSWPLSHNTDSHRYYHWQCGVIVSQMRNLELYLNTAPLQNTVFTWMQGKVCSLNLLFEYVNSSLICVQSMKMNHAKFIRPHSAKPRCALLNGYKCSQKKELYIVALMHEHYRLFTYSLTPGGRVLLEKLTGSAASRNSPHFMEPEGSSLYSQVPAICPYPEPTPSSPHPLPLPEDPS